MLPILDDLLRKSLVCHKHVMYQVNICLSEVFFSYNFSYFTIIQTANSRTCSKTIDFLAIRSPLSIGL